MGKLVKDKYLSEKISDYSLFADVLGVKHVSSSVGSISSLLTSTSISSAPNSSTFRDQLARSLIAVRGTDVFTVTSEGDVGFCDCSNLRDLSDSRRFYKILNIPRITFHVRSLVVNESGTYMAIVGENEISVCSLPLPGSSRRSESRINSQIFNVGSKFFTGASLIHKVLWHPLSKSDSSILVLSSDRVLRLFDLDSSRDDPDRIYDFNSASNPQEFSYGLTDEVKVIPVSMCFGIREQGPGQATLYILSDDGNIYVLSPFLPRKNAILLESVQVLLEWARAEALELESATTISRSERYRRRQQLSWASEIARQTSDTLRTTGILPRINRFGELSDVGLFDRTAEGSEQCVALQGPLRLKPYPRGLYAAGTVTDILSLELEDYTLLLVAYSTGRLNFYLQLMPTGTMWESSIMASMVEHDEPEVEEIITLDLIASISLHKSAEPAFSKPRVPSLNSLYEFSSGLSIATNFVLVRSMTELIQVDFSRWKQEILEVFNSAQEYKLQQFLTSKPAIEFFDLFPGESNCFSGVVVLPDLLLGDLFILLRNSRAEVLSVNGDSQPTGKFDINSKEVKSPSPPTRPEYQTSLNLFKVDSTLLKQEASRELKLSQLRKSAGFNLSVPMESVTEQSLNCLGQIEEIIQTDLRQIYLFGAKLHLHATEQREEMERQLNKISEFNRRVEKIVNQAATFEKTRAVEERQAILDRRLEDLHGKLIRCLALPISESELGWFSEIDRLNTILKENHGTMRQAKLVLDQSRQMIAIARGLEGTELEENRPAITSELRPADVEDLRRMLEAEALLINRTRNSLASLDTKMDKKLQDLITREI
ncbi:uncharacterized protein V1516DRAFT_250267 [Lipomyces oligophaga]|uniref:uncharacterized protein n=1 Tax=Lipomyces oligophaga TaxID=45792 RepID=UPI0034CD38A8